MWLGDEDEVAGPNIADRSEHLVEFRLELGLPVWRYELAGLVDREAGAHAARAEHRHVTYRLLEGEGPVRLSLRPSIQFRGYEAPVDTSLGAVLHPDALRRHV